MATRAVIADNQKMFTEGIQAILTDMRFPPIKIVGVAYSLEELNKMTVMPIDLLIIELAIADTKGASFISELKKAQPGIRIIVLSNYGEAHFVRDAFIQGADGYVLKSEIDAIYQSIPGNKKALIGYEEAGHESLLMNEPERWKKTVLGFMQQYPG